VQRNCHPGAGTASPIPARGLRALDLSHGFRRRVPLGSENYNHFAQLFLKAVPTEVSNMNWGDFFPPDVSSGTTPLRFPTARCWTWISGTVSISICPKTPTSWKSGTKFGTLTNRAEPRLPDRNGPALRGLRSQLYHQVYHSAEEHDEMLNAGGGPSLYYHYMTIPTSATGTTSALKS